jgi:hypothetical protein
MSLDIDVGMALEFNVKYYFLAEMTRDHYLKLSLDCMSSPSTKQLDDKRRVNMLNPSQHHKKYFSPHNAEVELL